MSAPYPACARYASGAALLAILVRIETAFQFHDAHVHTLVQQQVDGPLRRVRPRRIRIEIHYDLPGMPPQRLHLLRRQRRSATRHHLAHARRVDADRIHVPFHQYRPIRLPDAFLGPVQVVEHGALLIYRRFRGIQILGFVRRIERAPAEADHLPRFAVDRKHQPVAETVVEAAVFAPPQQTGVLQLLGGEPLLLQNAAAARGRSARRIPARIARSFPGDTPRFSR